LSLAHGISKTVKISDNHLGIGLRIPVSGFRKYWKDGDSMIDRINRAGQMQNAQNISELKGKENKRVEKSKVSEQEKEALVVQEGKKVAEYIEMAKNYPEVRTELVQQIKEAIENGTFKVDVEKIAKKLLEG